MVMAVVVVVVVVKTLQMRGWRRREIKLLNWKS